MNSDIILSIQRFGADDDSGIRSTVFFKGCPLRCRWCHNPNYKEPEWLFKKEKCISCMHCASVCSAQCHVLIKNEHQFLRENCSMCGRCAEICSQEALRPAGYSTNVQEIMEILLRDRAYYQTSGGGITLSGGEPLFQPFFA